MIALCQFLEFASENIVHPQRLRDFTGDVAVLRPPGIHIRFLQQNQVRWRSAAETRCTPSSCCPRLMFQLITRIQFRERRNRRLPEAKQILFQSVPSRLTRTLSFKPSVASILPA